MSSPPSKPPSAASRYFSTVALRVFSGELQHSATCTPPSLQRAIRSLLPCGCAPCNVTSCCRCCCYRSYFHKMRDDRRWPGHGATRPGSSAPCLILDCAYLGPLAVAPGAAAGRFMRRPPMGGAATHRRINATARKKPR